MSRTLRHLLIALALLFTQQAAQLHALSHLGHDLEARRGRRGKRAATRPSGRAMPRVSCARQRAADPRVLARAAARRACRASRASRCLCSTRRGSCSIRARLPHSPSCFSTEPRFARRGCQRPPSRGGSPTQFKEKRHVQNECHGARCCGGARYAPGRPCGDRRRFEGTARAGPPVEGSLRETHRVAGEAAAANGAIGRQGRSGRKQGGNHGESGCGPGEQPPDVRERPQSGRVGDHERHLCQPVAGPGEIQDQRLRADHGRGRAAGARPEPG